MLICRWSEHSVNLHLARAHATCQCLQRLRAEFQQLLSVSVGAQRDHPDAFILCSLCCAQRKFMLMLLPWVEALLGRSFLCLSSEAIGLAMQVRAEAGPSVKCEERCGYVLVLKRAQRVERRPGRRQRAPRNSPPL
jgi:hypothetical protein